MGNLEGAIKLMWGICFDTIECEGELFPSRLFQSVIEYELVKNGTMANIIYPKKGASIAVNKIRVLDNPPQFLVGELVSPANHPDQVGVIREIGWHFKNEKYMYFISINNKKKSKIYYCNDLIRR
ncbi:MAG: hypothetical protein K1W16_12105 [Lachnospiraceae bacterium]|jgi:hypothetical protein